MRNERSSKWAEWAGSGQTALSTQTLEERARPLIKVDSPAYLYPLATLPTLPPSRTGEVAWCPRGQADIPACALNIKTRKHRVFPGGAATRTNRLPDLMGRVSAIHWRDSERV